MTSFCGSDNDLDYDEVVTLRAKAEADLAEAEDRVADWRVRATRAEARVAELESMLRGVHPWAVPSHDADCAVCRGLQEPCDCGSREAWTRVDAFVSSASPSVCGSNITMNSKAFERIESMTEKPAPPKFEEFPKIPRLNREIIITEKIDGTNASIHIAEDGSVYAGSRSRWITPENDNHGFAKWVKANEDALRTGLGFGTHFGEWWGAGIQRRYGLAKKRFSLFNVHRWTDDVRPSICHVVPTLYRGAFNQAQIILALEKLRAYGSVAAPGFINPEGVIVFHVPSQTMFKATLDKDDEPKGRST